MHTRYSSGNAEIRTALHRQGGLKSRKEGMVLIIVLTCLALLAILIISFMSGATNELAASKQYSVSAEIQNLASSALNLAMGQVARGARANENSVSWASQPGMIRNFDTSGTHATALYKLYSSANMIVTGADAANFAVSSETPPQDWDTIPVLFTDLNSPTGDGTDLRFPIVDPRASVGATKVDGFSYQASVNGVVSAASNTDSAARLPMPVEWLYVLKDGSFAAATSADGKSATVSGASKTNPIIGRIAFWTDDESCKVNVNTASEGNFWDTPMATLRDEGPLNAFTPAAGEYQRYAGHPATTSLSAVFPWLKGTALGSKDDQYLQIAPRIVAGGSREGTQWPSGADALAPDPDRLYDSVDEVVFDSSRNFLANVTNTDIEARRFFLTAQSKSPETTLFNTPRVTIWPLHVNETARHASEKLIAFASTSAANNGRQYFFTRQDPLDPAKDFSDATRSGRNAEILGYLKTMTSWKIPGYARSFEQKWGAADRDQILVEIYDYIRSTINLRTKVLNGVVSTSPSAVSYTQDSNGRKGNVCPTVLPLGTGLGSGNTLGSDTRGFGRFATVKEISMLFACEQNPVMTGNSNTTMVPVVDSATGLLAGLPSDPARPAKIWPALLVEMFLPSQGLKVWQPNLKVTLTGLNSFTWVITDFSGNATSVPMFASDKKVFNARGDNALYNPQVSDGNLSASLLYLDVPGDSPAGPTRDNWSPDFLFNGGTVNVTVDIAESAGDPNVASVLPANARQQFSITFPPMTNRLPNPRLAWTATPDSAATYGTIASRLPSSLVQTYVDSSASGASQAAGLTIGSSGFSPQYPDIVKSMVIRHGDARLVAASSGIVKGGVSSDTTNTFVPHPFYFSGLPPGATVATNTNLYARPSDSPAPYYYNAQNLHKNASRTIEEQEVGKYVFGPDLAYRYEGWGSNGTDTAPSIPAQVIAANFLGRQGDWDSGVGNSPDGPYINKVDEGTDWQTAHSSGSIGLNYLWNATWDSVIPQTERTFGPMRQIASPVMFGSLPTAVKRNRPWETLLFCPNPAASFTFPGPGFTSAQHPGFESPPDHLLLDLFWMPVTEPYAISDNFSTSGKINLNFQILPFSYIKRDTGMRAVLANQKIAAFPEERNIANSSLAYKKFAFYSANSVTDLANFISRWNIDASETLSQFDKKFLSGEIFKSATEICDIFLVPAGETLATTTSPTGFWSSRRLTGDNMRERPYNAIYPRVTTQSNVYTVYVKAQSLKQVHSTLSAAPDSFTEGKDVVEGEFQASYTFERYIEPNAPLSGPDTDPLGSLYKLRVINQRNLSY